jgi:hypothetical protein
VASLHCQLVEREILESTGFRQSCETNCFAGTIPQGAFCRLSNHGTGLAAGAIEVKDVVVAKTYC